MPKAKKEKGKGSSSTPGRSKGANCQRSILKNIMAKDPKIYKTNPRLYAASMREVDSMKGNRMHNDEWYREQATGVEVPGAF